MNNYQGQQIPPSDVQPPAKSNKKLWIILGSVIGLLVIVMGGCIACGGLFYLSTLNNRNLASSDSDPNSTDDEPQSTSSRRSRTGAPGTLAGNTWKGNMNCDDGDNVPVVLRFAESGGPIYEYQTRDGLREVELTSSGQIVRFIPPGGGVTTVEVNSLSVSPDRVNQAVYISHEGGAGATLEQSRTSVTTDMSLSGEELEVETKIRSQSAISQPGIAVPGNEQVVTCSGKLRQE